MSVVAYHFWSPTCAPCNHIKPSVAILKEEFDTTTWVSVNIADDKERLAEKYGVKVVPTIAVEWNGRVEKHSGTGVAGYYRILRTATQK
jgi:thiol-disulfide isomerase/thioredoxin